MSFRRDLANMSKAQWAIVCVSAFVVSMGASMGLLTPSPHQLDRVRLALTEPFQSRASGPAVSEIEVIRPSSSISSMATHFPLCGGRPSDCVVDGDTFWYRGSKIRIADIDAPEIGGAKCASERALGERAKLRLAELLSSASFELASYESRDRDQYGRLLRVAYRGSESIGGILVSEGLARPWTGRRRPWC
ncbi:thermonuclease family protein [Bosea sp. NPDC055353]